VGGLGEIEIKAKLSPAEAGFWVQLGNIGDDIEHGKTPVVTVWQIVNVEYTWSERLALSQN
jgi:hypothetical protein